MKTFPVPESELKPHPLLKALPTMWDLEAWAAKRAENATGADYHEHPEEAEAMSQTCRRFEAGIKSRGIEHPIKVAKAPHGWWIVGGRHRFHAGRAAGETKFVCVLVPDDQVREVILSEEVERKQLSKQALAFTVLQAYPHLYREAKPGRPAKIACSSGNYGSLVELAASIGVKRDTIQKVAEFAREVEADTVDGQDKVNRLFFGQSIQAIHSAYAVMKGQREDGKSNGDPTTTPREHWTGFFNVQAAKLKKQAEAVADLSDADFLNAMNKFWDACPPKWRQRALKRWEGGEE